MWVLLAIFATFVIFARPLVIQPDKFRVFPVICTTFQEEILSFLEIKKDSAPNDYLDKIRNHYNRRGTQEHVGRTCMNCEERESTMVEADHEVRDFIESRFDGPSTSAPKLKAKVRRLKQILTGVRDGR